MRNFSILFLFIVYRFQSFGQASTLINGVFSMDKSAYYNSSSVLVNNIGVSAYFKYVATSNISPSSIDTVKTVRFNNTKLDLNRVQKLYSKNSLSSAAQSTWAVTGYSTIPNMNFTYNGVLPSFSVSTTLLNSTLKKSDTLFIYINNILSTDSIVITFMDDNQLPTQHTCCYKSRNHSNKYYMPPAFFSTLSVGPRGYIKIDAINYNYQTISSKQYLFRNVFSFARENINIIN